MDYTKNYHLPQWVATDRIMRKDFNEAMSNIESGIDTARSEAAELPYVVGSYTGDGEIHRDIYLGFKPRFVLICTTQKSADYYYTGLGMSMAGPTVDSDCIYMTDTGFHLIYHSASQKNPDINRSGEPYDYIAFR